MATSTPWGTADHAEHIARGIVWYTTPSHGGYHISPGRMKEMPDVLRRIGMNDGDGGAWFEEDCDWAAVEVTWPEECGASKYLGGPRDALGTALCCLRNWHPAEYEWFTGLVADEQNSAMRRSQARTASRTLSA